MSLRALALLSTTVGILVLMKTLAQDFKETALVVDTNTGTKKVYFSISHTPGERAYEVTLNPEGGGYVFGDSNRLTVRLLSDQPPTPQEIESAIRSTSDFQEGLRSGTDDYSAWSGAIALLGSEKDKSPTTVAFNAALEKWNQQAVFMGNAEALREELDRAKADDKNRQRRAQDVSFRFHFLRSSYEKFCNVVPRPPECDKWLKDMTSLQIEMKEMSDNSPDVLKVKADHNQARAEALEKEVQKNTQVIAVQSAAASSRVDTNNVYCCGSDGNSEIQKVDPAYCKDAKKSKSASISFEGFDSIELYEVCQSSSARRQPKLCFNDNSRCMYIDKRLKLYIPFEGRVVCSVASDASCSENPTQCARQQQKIHTENFGEGGKDLKLQIRSRFGGREGNASVQDPRALPGN